MDARWWEIQVVIEGAVDETRIVTEDPDDEAERLAEEIESAAQWQGFEDWAIYVLPHFCRPDDEDECVCRQYDTDHKPAYVPKGA